MSTLENEIAYRVRYLIAQGKTREEALEIAQNELLAVSLAPIAHTIAKKKSKKRGYQRAAARESIGRARVTSHW